MNKKILVTGVNGFVGQHLVDELKVRNIDVVGVAHSEAVPDLTDKLESFFLCDLTSQEQVAGLNFENIDAVIHLAALSVPAVSFQQPQLYISANSAMVVNLYERILAQKLHKSPRVVMVSTGAVYSGHQSMPITEDGEIAYSSPYSISKLLSENLAEYYHSRGIESVIARPLNHTGPGQPEGFIVPDMIKQLLEVGAFGTLNVGNLKSRRDYTDVRDVVRAYVDLATVDTLKNRLYNICSGTSRSGEELIGLISEALFGHETNLEVVVDQSKIRPNDPAEIFGDNSLINRDLGWKPVIPFEQTIKDSVDRALPQRQDGAN